MDFSLAWSEMGCFNAMMIHWLLIFFCLFLFIFCLHHVCYHCRDAFSRGFRCTRWLVGGRQSRKGGPPLCPHGPNNGGERDPAPPMHKKEKLNLCRRHHRYIILLLTSVARAVENGKQHLHQHRPTCYLFVLEKSTTMYQKENRWFQRNRSQSRNAEPSKLLSSRGGKRGDGLIQTIHPSRSSFNRRSS